MHKHANFQISLQRPISYQMAHMVRTLQFSILKGDGSGIKIAYETTYIVLTTQ